MLKGQDIVVLSKLILIENETPAVNEIASALALSPSECHAAFKRLRASGLLHVSEGESRALKKIPNRHAAEEFFVHALKFIFPPEWGQMTRGMPTCLDAPVINSNLSKKTGQVAVWPWSKGKVAGLSLKPLYRTVPQAANRDPELYRFLALTDALRAGRARERKIATEGIISQIRSQKND